MDFIQKFNTSRQNYDNGDTRIGEKDRLWYDSNSNTIRISDGVTPGGLVVSGGGGGSLTISNIDNANSIFNEFTSTTALRFNFSQGFSLIDLGDGAVEVGLVGLTANTDGGLPGSNFGGITSLDGGGI